MITDTLTIQLIANGATEEEMVYAINYLYHHKNDIKKRVNNTFNKESDPNVEDLYCLDIDLITIE